MERSRTRTGGARVSLDGLDKRFGERQVLQAIDLDVAPGELVTIVGRSGSGKSTLLRILCGLEQPDRGTARVASDAVRVVFQEPRLLPWRSVLQNVLIGLSGADEARGRAVLDQVGLGDRLHEYPGVLSGGQRQRVALARALVHEPQVMLFDEPFGALDALTRVGAQRLVESLWTRHGFTALLVTHDVEEAVLLGDRVLVLEEGRIACSLRVDLPRPRTREMPEVGRLAGTLLGAIFGRAELPGPGRAGATRLAAPDAAAGAGTSAGIGAGLGAGISAGIGSGLGADIGTDIGLLIPSARLAE